MRLCSTQGEVIFPGVLLKRLYNSCLRKFQEERDLSKFYQSVIHICVIGPDCIVILLFALLSVFGNLCESFCGGETV